MQLIAHKWSWREGEVLPLSVKNRNRRREKETSSGSRLAIVHRNVESASRHRALQRVSRSRRDMTARIWRLKTSASFLPFGPSLPSFHHRQRQRPVTAGSKLAENEIVLYAGKVSYATRGKNFAIFHILSSFLNCYDLLCKSFCSYRFAVLETFSSSCI